MYVAKKKQMKEELDKEIDQKKKLQSDIMSLRSNSPRLMDKLQLQNQPILDGENGILNHLMDNRNYQRQLQKLEKADDKIKLNAARFKDNASVNPRDDSKLAVIDQYFTPNTGGLAVLHEHNDKRAMRSRAVNVNMM